MTEGLDRYLDYGVLGVTVFALIVALGWTVRQWRQAEKEKDELWQARLSDNQQMVLLANEVKTSMEVLVKNLGARRR